MREVITMGAAIMLAALTWTASQPHSLAAEQQTAAAAKAPKILLRATLSLAQPPFAGAVESVQADGQLRIGPLKAKSGVAAPENGPLTEGLYLGVVRGTYKDLRDANLLRVNVTNITTEGVVDAQVGRGLDDRILVGKLILLVRPPQSTSAQLKALPDLVTIETGPAPISDPVASTPDATPPAAESARVDRSVLNLTAIARGLYKYLDGRKTFPPAALIGPDGKPWHSWRVLILPTIGDPALRTIYDHYKFDEPWDGPNNKKLLKPMPGVYTDQPAGAPADTFTRYAAVTGQGTKFSAEGNKFDPAIKPMRFGRGTMQSDIADGASNALMIGTLASDAKIPWTKPEDIVLGEPPARRGPLALRANLRRESTLYLRAEMAR